MKDSGRNKKNKNQIKKLGSSSLSESDRELFWEAYYAGEVKNHQNKAPIKEEKQQTDNELFLKALENLPKKNLKVEDASKKQSTKQNKQPIYPFLDLHGMFVEEAIKALLKFINQEQKKGAKTALVIHG